MDIRQTAQDTIRKIVDGTETGASEWAERGFFVVDIQCKGAAGDEIEVVVDCDGTAEENSLPCRKTGVGIDDCAALNREIAGALEQILGEETDYSLSVMSAGLGQPLKLGRQYEKLLHTPQPEGTGPRVDVLFKDGRKLTGVILCGIGYNNSDPDMPMGIEVICEVKELLPGKKRKEIVQKREQIILDETKVVSEHFDFK